MASLVQSIGRRPAAAMLDSICVLTAAMVHTAGAIALTVAVLAISMLRRDMARRRAGGRTAS